MKHCNNEVLNSIENATFREQRRTIKLKNLIAEMQNRNLESIENLQEKEHTKIK